MNAVFWIVPLIVGSLYGGYVGAAGLSLLFIVLGIPNLDSWWEKTGFVLFVAAFLPILFFLIGPFFRGQRRVRQRLAVVAAVAAAAVLTATLIMYAAGRPAGMLQEFNMLAMIAAVVLETSAAIFLIESVMEKQLLQNQLHRVSHNYRNEVQKLQQFIDMAPLGVIVVDREGIVTHVNGKACQCVGQPDEARRQLIGRHYSDLRPDMTSSAVGKLLLNALSGDDSQSDIVQENNKIYIETGFGIRDMGTGSVIGAGFIALDITEVSRLQDEIGRMDRLSMVGQMAASITHEIRNPMAVIRGFVQLMRERSPDHYQEYYRIILEELDRTNMIINDFLSLAQNRLVEKEVIPLQSILEDLEPLLWADANLRGQSVEFSIENDMPPIELNAKEIKQLILNLARNGMEAMDDKGVLRIVACKDEERILLKVTDTGTGIPREQLERLFEPFYTTKTRGTGLGLPLCLSIVERHNGQIEVNSIEGQGTTFTVTFFVKTPAHGAV